MSNDGVGMMQTNVGSFRGGLLQMNLRKSLVYFLLSSLSVIITRIQGTNGVLCLWVILILQTMQQWSTGDSIQFTWLFFLNTKAQPRVEMCFVWHIKQTPLSRPKAATKIVQRQKPLASKWPSSCQTTKNRQKKTCFFRGILQTKFSFGNYDSACQRCTRDQKNLLLKLEPQLMRRKIIKEKP